jgi:N-acetylneuraminate synthase
MHTFIVAEAGVNHNGSRDVALELVDAAARAGADAVKFQSFHADALVTRAAPMAAYQARTSDPMEGQRELLRRLELSVDDHVALAARARARGLEFLSTPFDDESLEMLTGTLRVTTIKVSSGDLTHAPFLLRIARSAARVVLSTGMGTLDDVQRALSVLAFGFTQPDSATIGLEPFGHAFASGAGQQALRDRVTLLHCTTEYPAPIDDVNLRAIDTLATTFRLPVGYSDHTVGIHVPIAAVARGACLVEKHLTLDRAMAGVDQAASIEPGEFAALVAAIRDIERALGDGVKQPTPAELANRLVARRSLVASRQTRAGEPLDVTCKRPGTGLSPFDYWRVNGRRAERDYDADEIIDA